MGSSNGGCKTKVFKVVMEKIVSGKEFSVVLGTNLSTC